MEIENQYQFRTIGGQPQIITEKNTKIIYTISRRHQLGRLVIAYDRVQILRTARARVVYFAYNNPLARFKRALRPAISHRLHDLGIQISVQ